MLTARGRLTILYTALVLAAGIVLTGLTYLLMRRDLGRRLSVLVIHQPPGSGPPPLPSDFTGNVRDVTLSEFLTQAGIALAAVTLLAAVLGWLVAGRVLRTMNGMLARIQQSVVERDRALASQRMFTANAAHELRTPLTTMRTAIDVTLDNQPGTAELLDMTHDVRTAVSQSQRIIDGLLTLARSQAGAGSRQRVDLASIVAGALDGVSLTVRADLRAAPVLGEPVLLERLSSNLVDNAVRHNRPGGFVEVATGVVDGRVFLRIGNSGPPVTDVDRLREPFVRGEGARIHTDRGVGLGLSIVDAVVTAHHGEMTIAARPAGGLDIAIHLPARP